MATKSKIHDQTFLFTGTLTEFTREEAEALVESNGGKVLSGVSAKLNYLIVGTDAGSKLEKAKALGTVKILSEKEFLKMIPKLISNVLAQNKLKAKKQQKDIHDKDLNVNLKSVLSVDNPIVEQYMDLSNTLQELADLINNPTEVSKKKSKSKKVVKIQKIKKQEKSNKSSSNYHDTNEVIIGNQIWMVNNLDVGNFRNGDPIQEAKTKKAWKEAGEKGQPAWCYYDNSRNNGKKYGKLYNWHAVNDKHGLAPEGWHIPTDDEWEQLVDFIGGDKKAGKKLKSKQGWNEGGNGNDNFGFACLPGGYRAYNGTFDYIGQVFDSWSSTVEAIKYAWYRRLSFVNEDVNRYNGSHEDGLSVRCIKD